MHGYYLHILTKYVHCIIEKTVLGGTILLTLYLYYSFQNFTMHREELYLCRGVFIIWITLIHLKLYD